MPHRYAPSLLAFALLTLLVPARALADAVESSSAADVGGSTQSADLAFDGLLSTTWIEGDEGSGAGSWIELRDDRAQDIVSVSIWPGNVTDGWASLKEYARPRTITVQLIGGSGTDEGKTVRLEDGALVGVARIDVPIRGRARGVRVTIDDVYEGLVHPDQAAITEIALNFAEGEAHPWVGKVFSWIEGEEGIRPREENLAQIASLHELTAGPDEEAATQALHELMTIAAEGAPYVRRWTDRYVPRGHRMSAILPDKDALEVLFALRDPRSISAVERASVRARGHQERALADKVDKFYAYQELIGGPSSNVPNWGESGWAVGQLQGLGEPLALQLDQAGGLYVADTGNSRVQRFSDTGRVEAVMGAQAPAITNRWLGGERVWYVSGSDPEAEGALPIPLDVAILPGKLEDRVAVLDGTGAVHVYDSAGKFQNSFKAPVSNMPLLPGVGGQAYLEFVKDQLVLLWSDEAYLFSFEGEQLGHWDINDGGVPSATTALKGGKLGLVFQDQLVEYSVDGFRHGSLLGDTLGQGFEAWDVALDNESRLWAVTDTGWAVKYKKPGKVDYKVRLTEDGFVMPRIAARDDVVYVCHGDRIEVFDALELYTRAQLASGE